MTILASPSAHGKMVQLPVHQSCPFVREQIRVIEQIAADFVESLKKGTALPSGFFGACIKIIADVTRAAVFVRPDADGGVYLVKDYQPRHEDLRALFVERVAQEHSFYPARSVPPLVSQAILPHDTIDLQSAVLRAQNSVKTHFFSSCGVVSEKDMESYFSGYLARMEKGLRHPLAPAFFGQMRAELEEAKNFLEDQEAFFISDPEAKKAFGAKLKVWQSEMAHIDAVVAHLIDMKNYERVFAYPDTMRVHALKASSRSKYREAFFRFSEVQELVKGVERDVAPFCGDKETPSPYIGVLSNFYKKFMTTYHRIRRDFIQSNEFLQLQIAERQYQLLTRLKEPSSVSFFPVYTKEELAEMYGSDNDLLALDKSHSELLEEGELPSQEVSAALLFVRLALCDIHSQMKVVEKELMKEVNESNEAVFKGLAAHFSSCEERLHQTPVEGLWKIRREELIGIIRDYRFMIEERKILKWPHLVIDIQGHITKNERSFDWFNKTREYADRINSYMDNAAFSASNEAREILQRLMAANLEAELAEFQASDDDEKRFNMASNALIRRADFPLHTALEEARKKHYEGLFTKVREISCSFLHQYQEDVQEGFDHKRELRASPAIKDFVDQLESHRSVWERYEVLDTVAYREFSEMLLSCKRLYSMTEVIVRIIEALALGKQPELQHEIRLWWEWQMPCEAETGPHKELLALGVRECERLITLSIRKRVDIVMQQLDVIGADDAALDLEELLRVSLKRLEARIPHPRFLDDEHEPLIISLKAQIALWHDHLATFDNPLYRAFCPLQIFQQYESIAHLMWQMIEESLECTMNDYESEVTAQIMQDAHGEFSPEHFLNERFGRLELLIAGSPSEVTYRQQIADRRATIIETVTMFQSMMSADGASSSSAGSVATAEVQVIELDSQRSIVVYERRASLEGENNQIEKELGDDEYR